MMPREEGEGRQVGRGKKIRAKDNFAFPAWGCGEKGEPSKATK